MVQPVGEPEQDQQVADAEHVGHRHTCRHRYDVTEPGEMRVGENAGVIEVARNRMDPAVASVDHDAGKVPPLTAMVTAFSAPPSTTIGSPLTRRLGQTNQPAIR